MVNKNENEYYCECDVIHEEVIKNAKKDFLSDFTYEELSDFFKVLGDNTRIKIIWALKEHEMCVCDIAFLLNMTKSAISHQLKTLKMSNFVKSRREGKNIFYYLSDEHISQIYDLALVHILE